MAFSKELEQNIFVKAVFKGKPSLSTSNPPVREVQRTVIRVMDNTSKKIRPIGAKLGQVARMQQHEGLVYHRAIFKHKLYDSIQSKPVLGGNSASGAMTAHYTVGTTLNEQYPLALIRGRKAVRAKGKALRVRLTAGIDNPGVNNVNQLLSNGNTSSPSKKGNDIPRKSVKASKPKNYMARADSTFIKQVPKVVEGYLNDLFT